MDWAHLGKDLVVTVYTLALAIVCLYGFHRYALMFLYYRHRRNAPAPAGRFESEPHVTIQLPMYNEQFVAERIIEATCRIDWPRGRLQIQVLDDSTDSTVEIARLACDKARAAGFDIEYVHRNDRSGYKAGALANGLKTAKGEFVTIFDADFVPNPDILRRSIDYFTDPGVCAVQARWEHINRRDSLLTQTQAIYLDGHFAIEHVARNRSGRWMSFNGTAGTWRRRAIADAGGWQHDTLTEDMDLSYRAQIRGWKLVFLPDLTAPAELPPEMNAFKAQQFRWTKGGVQTCIKMLPRILLSKAPLKAKIEAFFHLTCFTVHGFVLLLALLLFPAMWCRLGNTDINSLQVAWDITVFTLATISGSLFYIASQYELFRDWRTVIKYLPFLIALGVGVSVSNTKALLEALSGKQSEFVRTPKFGAGTANFEQARRQNATRKSRRRLLPYIEAAMGAYMLVCVGLTLWLIPKGIMAVPFMLMFAVGFFYVSILSIQGRAAVRRAKPALAPAKD